MSFALACDFRVMATSSKLAMAFSQLGLSGDSRAMYLLNKLLGLAKTTGIMMFGEPRGGEETPASRACHGAG